MTSFAAGAIPGPSGRWRRELIRVALHPDGPGTLVDLARVLGQATGAEGAVLWAARSGPDGCTMSSMLCHWLGDPVSPEPRHPTTPDPLTDLAFRIRSLALPTDLSGDPPLLFGLPVAAAMPVHDADSATAGLGVLTLLGADELSADAFDVAAELVEILPELCATLRERQTLALLQACNTILHDADVESPDQPLRPERLREHLDHVCRLVTRALECTETTIFLQESPGVDGRYSLFASSGQSGQARVSDANAGEPAGLAEAVPRRTQAARVDGLLIELLLRSGNHVWGLIRCTRASESPLYFTSSDLPLLHPIVTAVAQYLRSWLHRQTISAENDSWLQLAAGIAGLNRLFADALHANAGWDAQRERRFAEEALRIVQDVVPESTQVVLSRAEPAGGSAGGLVPVSSIGESWPASPAGPGPTLAERVLGIGIQMRTTIPDELAREGAGPDVGWLLCTPVGVGDQVYGILTVTGPAGELPANSAQVCEIIADQLGLYRHLQEAWQVLRTNVRSQAETMEDLKHQLGSPLRIATDRTDRFIRTGRFDSRAEVQLKAVRGLCRKASRVAMSAGVFAALSRGRRPTPRTELLGVDELMRLLIAGADDAQVLSDLKRGITFQVDRDSVRRLGRRLVHVDTSFLQQCLGNLLDNAGKYGYPNTCVRIGGAMPSSHLVIEVTSTGIPLGPQDAEHCLQRNWRGELARNTTGEGSGIGLWIVDHLMRSMNGTVQICPDGDTTTVRLVLPLA
ncbi:MAG: sensor histidine kinase [Pseudonocardiaceae bacterium]